MRNILATALALALTGAVASADPIVDVLTGTDNGFRFSVIHTSTGGSDGQSGTITHDVTFFDVGTNVWDDAALGTHFHLELKSRTTGAISRYHVDGEFDYADLEDGVFSGNQLVGHLTFDHVSGETFLDGERFYYEDRAYSSAASKPNSRDGDIVTLWGATAYDRRITPGTPTIGGAFDLMPSSSSYGMDLRLQLGGQPVPEPGTLALFGLAGLGFVVYRRKRKTA